MFAQEKEKRSDNHIFITILAHHIINTIPEKLHEADIHIRRKRIRTFLATHVLVTTSLTTDDGRCIHMRGCSDPRIFHRRIYNTLKIKLTSMNLCKIYIKFIICSHHKKIMIIVFIELITDIW